MSLLQCFGGEPQSFDRDIDLKAGVPVRESGVSKYLGVRICMGSSWGTVKAMVSRASMQSQKEGEYEK